MLGETIDDAAGEAYDKVARWLGLGYPGGPEIDRLAREGSADALALPVSMVGDDLDLSFSGLKTAVVRATQKHREIALADVAASFQAALAEQLLRKLRRALERHEGARCRARGWRRCELGVARRRECVGQRIRSRGPFADDGDVHG